MQEEIQIKGESKKTVVKYFTTFSGQTSTDDQIYYVVTDANNFPIKLTQSIVETKYGLDPLNNNIDYSSTNPQNKVYSGTVVQSEANIVYTKEQKDDISNFYIQSILNQANPPGSSFGPPKNPFSAVFFEELPFNDYFMNVKINRSMNTIDTLNIYNITQGVIPKFNNNTGVLIGKLEAIQILADENGEKIRIPLKNVPVGIFNPSEEFPSIGSLDEEGNRIRLNIFETIPSVNSTSNLKGYSSFQSYLADIDYSVKDTANREIPTKYEYTTITDENGNFILHNVPVGQQTLMVEVDLLKFGLEPEEVALNFFSYPTEENPNVSNVPHFFFGQYPINIVPSWGDFQTGYTEVNLSIALDLRKWVTYYIYPISADVGRNSNSPRVLEELYAEGTTTPLKVFVRDMTKPFVPDNPQKVEIVKIPDIYDRNIDLVNSWNNEFKTKNNKVEFDTTNFNAFKLPANLYDPFGINSKGEKGVWLAAYQIKVSYPDPSISFQSTGWAANWVDDQEISTNHFDLTNYEGWTDDYVQTKIKKIGIGLFPYEKPWSLTYPEPYKITKRPSVQNPYKQWDSNGNPVTLISGHTINPYKEPKYLDGDLAGGSWGSANGFGFQNYRPDFFGNQFASEVTKYETWCYEEVPYWGWIYSNGYNPGLDSNWNDPKYSSLPGIPPGGKPRVDGEKWQRAEAGYAYWLRPRGWPKLDTRFGWGDFLLDPDHSIDSRSETNIYPGYFQTIGSVYKYLDEVTLNVGVKSPWWSKFGNLTMYRVEKPYYTLPKKKPFNETFVTLKFGAMLFEGTDPWASTRQKRKDDRDDSLVNLGVGTQSKRTFNYLENLDLRIHNLGSTKVTINGIEIFPEGSGFIDSYHFKRILGNGAELVLPGNSSYDPIRNVYSRANYGFSFMPSCNCKGPVGEGQPNSAFDDWGGPNVNPLLPDRYNGGIGYYGWMQLKYDYDGKNGLPAFEEGNPDGTYYLSSIVGNPVDVLWSGWESYTVISEDDNPRWVNYGEYWSVIRIAGICYMAVKNASNPPETRSWNEYEVRPKWTRTNPDQFLKSYMTNGIHFRILYDGSRVYENDLDFKNIK